MLTLVLPFWRPAIQRPSAAKLLEHKFVRAAKVKPGMLAERFEKYFKWQSKGGDSDSDDDDDIDDLDRCVNCEPH